MPPQSLSLSKKLSAFFARKIVWLWPEETKQWALAFEAELPEIATPFASARWVMGGAALLARESFRHFAKSLCRPLGVAAPRDPSVFAGTGGPAPRLPRLFAGLFLFSSLAMLCLPQVRPSLVSCVFFDQTKIHEYFFERNIQRLRKIAGTNHDPQLLAFLSLALSYDQEHLAWADEAIRRDPSLTWVDYSTAGWSWRDTDQNHFLSDERIARLQAFDPQNAATLLLSAEVISHPVRAHADYSHDTSEEHAWEREVAKNPAWVAAMDRAFSAPRFHDYFAQQVDLARQVCARYHISDAGLVGYSFFAPGLGNNLNIEAYSRFLVRSGDEAAHHKNWSQAIQDYEKVEQFAEKIPNENEHRRWLAAKIGGIAAKKLELAYEATNHPKEAQIAAAKFASWDKTNAEFQSHSRQTLWDKSRHRPWSKAERAGLVINLAVVVIAIVLPLTAVALLCVALAASYSRRLLGQFYRLVCLAADFAPIVLVLSFAMLFYAYRPYAHPFQNAPSREDLFNAATVAHQLPSTVGLFVFDFLHIHGRYYFGVGLTGVLSLLVFFLVYQMVPKHRNS
jgi:hypothetical protein